MILYCDLHTHTTASGHAYSTLAEMCQAARDRGLRMMGMTDHGPALPGGPHPYHFGNLRVLPREIAGVRVLRGVEANIISPDGELDLPDRVLARLDWVLAGFHSETGWDGGTESENTRAVLRALANPSVDAVVHPGNPQYPVDVVAVVKAARELGKAVELNNSSLCVSRRGSEANCRRFAEEIARQGAWCLISSDAHVASDVGRFDKALGLVAAAGISESNILNASVASVEAYLRERGKDIS